MQNLSVRHSAWSCDPADVEKQHHLRLCLFFFISRLQVIIFFFFFLKQILPKSATALRGDCEGGAVWLPHAPMFLPPGSQQAAPHM